MKRAWVGDHLVEVSGNEITTFRVHLKVTFVVDD
ncbi:MAG TPA: dodecin domain-containing protein [Thermoanaerobaculia bacterium]|nr:dodecin domain-containing protein [Thermoanaerobaculia bacterium]